MAAALGKSWAGAAPLLAEGGQRIQELIDKGSKLSGTTAEMAKAAGEFNDRLEELKASSAGMITQVSSQMLPALTALVNNFELVRNIVLTLIATKIASWASAAAAEMYKAAAANNAKAAAALVAAEADVKATAAAVANATANTTKVGATLAAAQADVKATASASALATARVAELRAAALAAEGAARLAIVTNGLVPAQQRAAAAATAHTAALAALSVAQAAAATATGTATAAHAASLTALTVAQRAASVTSRATAAALSLLGGPIGAITLLLGLGATAWAFWGKSSRDANELAKTSTEQSTTEILSNLEKQNAKLRERITLATKAANPATSAAAVEGGPAAEKLANLLSKINGLKGRYNELTTVEKIDLADLEDNYKRLSETITENKKLAGDLSKIGAEAAAKAAEFLKEPKPPTTAVARDRSEEARQRLLEAQTRLRLDTVRDSLSQEETLLDAFYQSGLVGESEYWNKKSSIQQRGYAEALSAIQEQITRQQAILAGSRSGSKEAFDAERDLIESISIRDKLQRDAAQSAALLYFPAQKSADDYRRKVEELNAELEELAGNMSAAARIRIGLGSEEFSSDAFKRGDTDTPEKIRIRDERRLQEVQFNEILEKQSIITGHMQLEEEKLQNLRNAGRISEIDLLNETSALRQRQADELKNILRALEALEAPNERQRLQIEQLRVAIQGLEMQTNQLADTFNKIFADAAADAFSDFITGAKNAKDAFKAFANSVIRDINRMVFDSLKTQLFGQGGPAAGIGGIFASIFGAGAAGGIGYGASGSAAATAMVPTVGGGFVPALADGTDYVPRDMMAMIHKGEAVIPASENRGRSAIVINQNFAAGTNRQTVDQAAAATGFAVSEALRRRGG